MMRKIKLAWYRHVTWPRLRRRLRDGIVAVQSVNQLMADNGVPRQRRRHLLRDLDRDPSQLTWLLDLMYRYDPALR